MKTRGEEADVGEQTCLQQGAEPAAAAQLSVPGVVAADCGAGGCCCC